MKILEVLTETRDTFKAITLRELYDKRRVLKQELNTALVKGEDDETIQDIEAELAVVNAEITQLEASLNESIDHKEMLRGLTQTLTQVSAELAEMEDDLRQMKSAARTEEEHDAVADYQVTVEKKRALVGRLTKRVKLRKAALGGV